MAGSARSVDSQLTGGPRVQRSLDGRFYLLASIAVGSATVGLLLFLDLTGRVGALVPLVLLVVGVALLLSSAMVLRREIASARPKDPPSRPVMVTPKPHIYPDRESAVHPVAHVPLAPRYASAADWRVTSAPVDPDEPAWLSWLPHGFHHPDPEERSLVPGVVTSPGRAGTLVAFPVPNYYGAVAPAPSPLTLVRPRGGGGAGSSRREPPRNDPTSPGVRAPTPRTSIPESDRNSPFSEEELDQMFPPTAAARSPFLLDAPDRIGVRLGSRRGPSPSRMPEAADLDDFDSFERAVEADAMSSDCSNPLDVPEVSTPELPTASPPSWLPERGDVTTPSRSRDNLPDLRTEAANPVPPHLRAVGPLLRFEPPPRGERARIGASTRSVCASCSKVVLNLRMSGPCPKCMRPLCNDCLREAFVTRGRGWCADCSCASATAS